MAKGVRVLLFPGKRTHKRESGAEMVGMASGTCGFLPFEQERMIPIVSLHLRLDLAVATETTFRKSVLRMTDPACGQATAGNCLGMCFRQRSRRWMAQRQGDGQDTDHDRAEHQGSLRVQENHGAPPRIHRSPNRTASAI